MSSPLEDRKRPSNRATVALLKSKFDKVKAVREAAVEALLILTHLVVRFPPSESQPFALQAYHPNFSIMRECAVTPLSPFLQ